jgi:hypothetical protein
LLPTIAVGIGEKFWIELGWLGAAIGLKGKDV